MVGGEAGIEMDELFAFRIVHRDVTTGFFHRKELGRRMVGAVLAEGRILRRANARGHPDPPGAVEHRVMHRGLALPDSLRAPIRRRKTRESGALDEAGIRRFRILRGRLYIADAVLLRIEYRQIISGILRRAVYFSMRIDG